MKYLDYAAMGMASGAYGAASSAYAEASRARAEVAVLWEENQRLRKDLDSQKYEREFQKWAEEMIYQFAKTVKAIADTPGEPVNDFIDLASFLHLIEAKELDTSHINGLDHKEKFDETLLRAQKLLNNLETKQEVQKYIREQEAARREEERLRAARVAMAAIKVQNRRLAVKIVLGLCVLVFMYAVGIESVLLFESVLLAIVSVSGAILCAYLLYGGNELL